MKSLYRWITFVSLGIAVGISCILLLMRFSGLHAPLIYDEIFSWITADPAHPFREVWTEVLRADVNVPLFNLLLRGWAYGVPMTIGWMRIVPIFFSVLTPVSAWFLAPKTWPRVEKIIFCTLLSCSFVLTLYSSFLRTYSLAVLLVCICTLLALQIVQAFIEGNAAPKKLWIAFGMCGILACYSHYFAAALFFITALFVLFASFYYKKQRLWIMGVILLVGIIWLFWSGPVFYSLFASQGTGVGDTWWFRRGKWLASWDMFEFLLGPNSIKLGILVFVIVGMTSFLFEERALFTRRPEVWLALLQIVLLGGTVGVIGLWCNLLVERYFLMVLPGILLLLTGLLMHLQDRWKGFIVLLPVFVWLNMGYFFKAYDVPVTEPSGVADTFAYVTHVLHRNEVLVAYDRITYPGPAARWTLEYFLPKNEPLLLTPLTRENASRMKAPESVPLVAPLSAFTYVMKFSEKYG
ncbi:MAG: hypothetical protein J6Q05_05245, partial [Elusimicrobiaceae bacterium]|nr:hypothetical protein [Elusimicrobiaceae bacterium]